MEAQLQQKNSELSSLTAKDIFFKYLRFLPLFIISVALALLVAYIYLRYTTPIYSAGGSLVLKNDQRMGGGDDRLQQLMQVDNNKNIQNEIELLRSKQLMERVVRQLHLNFDYYAIGNVREQNMYRDVPFTVEVFEISDSAAAFTLLLDFPNDQSFYVNGEKQLISIGQIFKNSFGVFRLKRNPGPNHTQYRVVWVPTGSRASALASSVLVAPKGQTGILLISMEATHPVLAADVINQLMKEYQKVTIEDKSENIRQTIAFIDDRLNVVERELDTVTQRLLAFQNANNIVDIQSQSSSYFSKIDKYDEEINKQRIDLEVAQTIEGYLRENKNLFNLVPSTLGITDLTLGTLISAYNALQLERKELIDANVPSTNARVIQKEDQLERVRDNILENIKNLRASYADAVLRLEQASNTVRAQAQLLPAKEQQLEEIKKQQQTKQAVLNLLMEKREESAISSAATISNIKILEIAIPNISPIRPNRRSIQLIAIVVGLAIPALFIFLVELMNDKVTTRGDIERLTNAPILGEVGHSHSDTALVVKSNNRSVVAEQFRIIRSNLQYVLTDIEKPVLLITSSFSGEGKSFVSTNMSAVLSLTNKKTVVLEFDIRKPKILSGLGLPKRPGLTNYMLGKATLHDLIFQVAGYDNLFVLPCGPVPPNPAELLLDPKLDELFVYLKQNFDVVVIDTAPVGMVSDAMTLSKYADATLYIVRQGHTYKKQIGLIDEFYRSKKLPKISLILNDVKIRTGYGYYGYGRYGYGKGYGSGYFEDDDDTAPTLLQSWFGWMDLKKWRKKKRRKKATA